MEIDISTLASYTALVKEYGPELIQNVAKAIKKPGHRLTCDDIEELRKRLKRPEEYENE